MRATDGEALKEVESMTTHRYCTTWEGTRLEYLGWMTIVTKSEDRQKNLEERLLRGRLDQPGVEVSTHTDTQRMEYSWNRSHDPGEDLRSRGEAKAQSLELVDRVTEQEAKKETRSRMNRHWNVRFPEIEGGQQSPWLTDRSIDWMDPNWKCDTSTKRRRWERVMTERHDPEVYNTTNRRL